MCALKQTTSHILMVRPANFGSNPETAESNAFQSMVSNQTVDEIKKKACEEFDTFVNMLRGKFIHVHVIEDTVSPIRPDAVFPNNWITFHETGYVITYPMESPLRRLERREEIIFALSSQFQISHRYYLEFFESESLYLEGTGSMVFDRVNRLVYACRSSRTHERVLARFCQITGYQAVLFSSVDLRAMPVYHTNVMMAMGDRFVVICMDSIPLEKERNELFHIFDKTGKEIIDLSLEQMDAFAGNMLQVNNDDGRTFLVMSEQAYNSLRADQIRQIDQYSEIISPPLYTIEKYGGGSARCMMAEIFLSVKHVI
jgi:hypothetical protein